MKARGSIEMQMVFGICVIGLLVVSVFAVLTYLDNRDKRNFELGQANVQAKWTAANLEAEQDKAARNVAVGKALIVADNARQAAEGKATSADQRWKEAVRESNRKGKPLATCDAVASSEPNGADAGGTGIAASGPGMVGSGVAARPAGPRFTFEFVRQYDTAWTGSDGEPVFEATDGGPGFAGSRTAWVTAEEIRDVHGENARRCSTDRRELDSLIKKIRAAAAAFDNANRGVTQ